MYLLQARIDGKPVETIKLSAIPNGTYTLTAWVQSSGGQNSCRVYAANFGGSDRGCDINKSMSSWTKVTVTGIAVTNGSCRIGIASDAKADNWCKVDDISLVDTDPVLAGRVVQRGNSVLRDRGIIRLIVDGKCPSADVSLTILSLAGRRIGTVRPGSLLSENSDVVPGVYFTAPVRYIGQEGRSR